ncbi:MAG: arginine--tRNA ligase [Mycoplasmoidaceae bacterium]
MKKNIIDELFIIFDNLIKAKKWNKVDYCIERTKQAEWGDFSTNLALVYASQLKQNPLKIAEEIKTDIKSDLIEKITITKPGFINVFLASNYYNSLLESAINKGVSYAQYDAKDLIYNIEYVSANPTGSLHIGHARNAGLGSTLANVWEKFGITVDREYYINDGGAQINKLGVSVLVRYKQLFDMKDELPEDSYKGVEPTWVAKELKEKYQNQFINTKYDEFMILDEKERKIINDFSKIYLMDKIKETLNNFRAKFNIYYPESRVFEEKLVDKSLEQLKPFLYKKDGALWLKTTDFKDDKDRVLIKSDGNSTYFLPDIAYHFVKLSRKKYTKIFDILGSDHSSYAVRIKASCECLGYKDVLEVIIMQMVKLTKNNQPFKMSKRTGQSLTLNDLIESIGVDASRWYLVSQSANSHLEIDVEKVTKKDNTNPLYYVMYAHARIAQILLNAKDVNHNNKLDSSKLINPKERELLNMIIYYPHIISTISETYDVHILNTFLLKLAAAFHSYYADVKIISDDDLSITNQRLNLIKAVKAVIASGLKIFEIDAVDKI